MLKRRSILAFSSGLAGGPFVQSVPAVLSNNPRATRKLGMGGPVLMQIRADEVIA